jgi:hypothetical protein
MASDYCQYTCSSNLLLAICWKRAKVCPVNSAPLIDELLHPLYILKYLYHVTMFPDPTASGVASKLQPNEPFPFCPALSLQNQLMIATASQRKIYPSGKSLCLSLCAASLREEHGSAYPFVGKSWADVTLFRIVSVCRLLKGKMPN